VKIDEIVNKFRNEISLKKKGKRETYFQEQKEKKMAEKAEKAKEGEA